MNAPETQAPEMRAGIRALVLRRDSPLPADDGATVLALLCAGACAPILAGRPWREAVNEVSGFGGHTLGRVAEAAASQVHDRYSPDAERTAARMESAFAAQFASAFAAGGDVPERVTNEAVDLLVKISGLRAALDAAVSAGNSATAASIVDSIIVLGSEYEAARRLIRLTVLAESIGYETVPPARDREEPETATAATRQDDRGEAPSGKRDKEEADPAATGEDPAPAHDTDTEPPDPRAPKALGRLKRWIRRRGVVLGVFIGLAACLMLTAVLAVAGQLRYESYRDATMAERLIQASNDASVTDGPLAQLLAAAAWRIEPSDAARAAMSRAVDRPATGLLPAADQGPLTTIAYNPDGTSVATGGSDGSVALWNTETWEPVLLEGGLGWEAQALEFSPNGLLLAAGTYDQLVLWEVQTGERIELGTEQSASYLAFDPLGTKLVAADYWGPATVWDTATFEPISSFDTAASITDIGFDPEGTDVIVSDSGTAALLEYDAETGSGPESTELDPAYVEEYSGVQQFEFSGHGRDDILVCDYGCRIWNEGDSGTLEPIRSLGYLSEPAAYTPMGNQIVGTAGDVGLGVWNAASGATVGLLPYEASIEDFAVSPDGRTVVAATHDGLQRWNSSRLAERVEIPLAQSMAGIYVPVNWGIAAGVGESGTDLWEFEYGGAPAESFPERVGWSTAITEDGTVVATAGDAEEAVVDAWEAVEPVIEVWDAASGETIRTLAFDAGPASGLEFSRDGALLAALVEVPPTAAEVESSQSLVIADWKQDQVQARIDFAAGESISYFELSPDATEVLTLNGSGQLQLWDVGDGSLVGEFTVAGRNPYMARFSPDGGLIAAASSDGVVFWDSAASESEPVVFDTGFSSSSISFFPDRPYVAVTEEYPVRDTDDRSPRIAVIDYEMGDVIATLPFNTLYAGIGVSPDADSLALVESGTITKLDVSYLDGDVHAIVCEQAGRRLTEAEWAAYLPELEPGSFDPCSTD